MFFGFFFHKCFIAFGNCWSNRHKGSLLFYQLHSPEWGVCLENWHLFQLSYRESAIFNHLQVLCAAKVTWADKKLASKQFFFKAASERFHTFHSNQPLFCSLASLLHKQPGADSCWYICDGLKQLSYCTEMSHSPLSIVVPNKITAAAALLFVSISIIYQDI